MKSDVYSMPSKPLDEPEGARRQVRSLCPTDSAGHHRSPEVAEHPQFVPAAELHGRAAQFLKTCRAIEAEVQRLAAIVKPKRATKANRRNGGGPRKGTDLRAIDVEACRARFEKKYSPEPNTGCWLWFGAMNRPGYGSFAVVAKRENLVMVSAHRVAFALDRGHIPEGMTLDHLCRVPACVNPRHMEVVTIEENVRRQHLHKGHNVRRAA